MTTLDMADIRNEIVDLLRRSDVISTSVRGVTRTTDTYTVGVGGETTHTFTGKTPTRNFYSITVNSVAKYYLRDFTMNWNTGVLTWNSALVSGDVVAYSIDWGSSEKIYPDMPRDDLTLESFPRIGMEIISVPTSPHGLGGMSHISDMLVQINVWVPVKKTVATSNFGGQTDLENTLDLIRAAIRSNAKSFYTFQYIYPQNTGPLVRGKDDMIIQRSQDYLIKFKTE